MVAGKTSARILNGRALFTQTVNLLGLACWRERSVLMFAPFHSSVPTPAAQGGLVDLSLCLRSEQGKNN